MLQSTGTIIQKLIHNISTMNEIKSVGISGETNPFPKAGEGDIDIFIYCDSIPEVQRRKVVMDLMGSLMQDCKTNVFEGGHWGTGDFGKVNDLETWLMYFTVDESLREVESILKGEYPDKLDNY